VAEPAEDGTTRDSRLSEAEIVSLARILLLVGALVLVSITQVDPDLWGHVRFGLDIIDTKAIASHDPYSFTSDRSWVNHEWLAEVFMGGAYRLAGAFGLVLLKTGVYATALVCASLALRRVAWRPIDHDLLILLAIMATFPRAHDMRPQVFSLALFAALLLVLVTADRGRFRPLLAVPLLMAVWANLHGGWIVGLATLGAWVLVRLVRPVEGGPSRAMLAGVGLVSVAATLINPYGVGLWTFLRDTVGLSRPDIRDWQPLFELPLGFILLVGVVFAVAAVAVVKAGRKLDPAYGLMVGVLAFATIKVSRNDAFFGLAVVMLLGPYLGRERARTAPNLRLGVRTLARPLSGAIALALVLGGAAYGAVHDRCVGVEGAPEPEAAAFIQREFSRARVLTYFNWGEYAIWQLAPDGDKVSMDGRRETVYTDALFDAHVRFYANRPGALRFAERLHPDLIWLPRRARVIAALRRNGWTSVFEGPKSVVLAPDGTAVRPVRVRSAPAGKRCFPDR